MRALRRLMSVACTAAGIAVAFVALSAVAQAGQRDLHVAVWGLDGALLDDALVGFETAAGTGKGRLLPDGCYLVPNDAIKGALTVEAPDHGSVAFEVRLPDERLVDVDVIYFGPGQADLVLDQPTKQARGDQGFNGGGPPNQDCADAQDLPLNETVMGTTIGAANVQLPACGTPIDAPGVWYRVQGTGFLMSATTCLELFDYDTKLSVFCSDCDDLVCVGGNDDGCTNGASEDLSTVTWCSDAGSSYLILVHGFGGASGEFLLRADAGDTSCADPVVCAASGACCLPSGGCQDDLQEADCAAINGYYQGDGTTCAGGFDGFDVMMTQLEFIDISSTGTPLNLGDDDFSNQMLGFEFNFLGNLIDNINVCSNGYLTIGMDTGDPSNDPCPDPARPNQSIFVLWDDWSPDTGGQVYVQAMGPLPPQVFIAQWNDVPQVNDPTVRATFQCVLFQGTNEIAFNYSTLEGFPLSPGEVTVGIENEDGSEAWCIDESTIAEGVNWSFMPRLPQPAFCPCRFVDFEFQDDFTTPLVNGEALASPPDFGNLFNLNGFGAGTLGTAIFDSDDPGPNTGGPDADLLVNLGNIVILQSADNPEQTVPGIYDTPSDAAGGGGMEFEFLQPIEPRRLDLIDICVLDSTSQVILTDANTNVRAYTIPGGWTTDVSVGGAGFGTLDLTTTAPQPGENGTSATAGQFPGFDAQNVVSMEVFLGNSGAIDNFEFCLPGITPGDGE